MKVTRTALPRYLSMLTSWPRESLRTSGGAGFDGLASVPASFAPEVGEPVWLALPLPPQPAPRGATATTTTSAATRAVTRVRLIDPRRTASCASLGVPAAKQHQVPEQDGEEHAKRDGPGEDALGHSGHRNQSQ